MSFPPNFSTCPLILIAHTRPGPARRDKTKSSPSSLGFLNTVFLKTYQYRRFLSKDSQDLYWQVKDKCSNFSNFKYMTFYNTVYRDFFNYCVLLRILMIELRNSSPHLILSGAERVELIIAAWLRLDFYNWPVIKNNDSVLGPSISAPRGPGKNMDL